jgi:hypothetical protein
MFSERAASDQGGVSWMYGVAHRTNGQIRELAVSITGRVAKLTGNTSRYYYKQLATSGVQDGGFGLDVENEISVGIR